MNNLSFYLQQRIQEINIDLSDMKNIDYLQLFKWLRDKFPSLSYDALFELYAFHNNINISNLDADFKKQLIQQYKNIPPTYLPLSRNIINKYMDMALYEAEQALQYNEVPIGAIVVFDNNIIGYGHNETITKCDVTAHAEINAIQIAQRTLGNYRLNHSDIYVTIEPCLMCIGAIINARLRRVIYGACEPLTGSISSQFQTLANKNVNIVTEGIGPIDNTKYGTILKRFFYNSRKNKFFNDF